MTKKTPPINKRPRAVQVTAARAKAAELLSAPRAIHLLSKHEVCAVAGVSYPTIWAWMRVGTFPRSRIVGGKSMWLSTDVDAWLQALPVRRLKGDAAIEREQA
jgi:predicted DNA-binding transcriptional regulator AlpA